MLIVATSFVTSQKQLLSQRLTAFLIIHLFCHKNSFKSTTQTVSRPDKVRGLNLNKIFRGLIKNACGLQSIACDCKPWAVSETVILSEARYRFHTPYEIRSITLIILPQPLPTYVPTSVQCQKNGITKKRSIGPNNQSHSLVVNFLRMTIAGQRFNVAILAFGPTHRTYIVCPFTFTVCVLIEKKKI